VNYLVVLVQEIIPMMYATSPGNGLLSVPCGQLSRQRIRLEYKFYRNAFPVHNT